MNINVLLALTLAFLPETSNGAEISAKISAVDNLWTSAQTEQGGLAPIKWSLPSALPTGERLIPGGLLSDGKQSLVLSNGMDSIEISLGIQGIQYMLFDSVGLDSDPVGNATTEPVGNIATVKGGGVGDKILTFSSNSSMIRMYRPILEPIDIKLLKEILKGKSKGVYHGIIPINFQYDYYRNNIRVKNIISTNLQFTIDYNPAIIFDAVIVKGKDGQLTPYYHGYPEKVVSAKGIYGVKITGDFTSGLRAKILDTTQFYTLKNPLVISSDISKQIAYSVTCIGGCLTNNSLVSNGSASSSFTQLDISNTSESHIDLMVHFENKPYEELENGDYQGHFQVLFEAQL